MFKDQKLFCRKKDFNILPLALSRSTDRSIVGRAKLLWSNDMHQSAFVHFGRPGGRPIAKALLSVAPVDRQVDRHRVLLSGWEQRLTDRSTAILNGQKSDRWRSTDRSTDRRIFFWIFSNGYILFCLFLGLFPTTLLSFLLIFSSPINVGLWKNSNKISKV